MQIAKYIPLKNVANFEYTGLMTVTIQVYIYGIDGSLNLESTCYQSGQNKCPSPCSPKL
jgi:hypothetical protein